MSSITVENLDLVYPLLGVNSRSLKKSLLNIATGGNLKAVKGTPVVVKALNNISFELNKGDRLGLIGHNGSGKSTLLRVLAGVYAPTSGIVSVSGSISSLFDVNIGIQPNLSGYQNIKTRGLILDMSDKDIDKLIPEIEEFTELGNYLSTPVNIYSSGMAVRLSFGLSTAIEPDILLIDEVFGAGDAQFVSKAEKRMNECISKSNIVVMASHVDSIIQDFCNKALWLEHGCIKGFGETKVVLKAYKDSVALASEESCLAE